MNVALSEFEKMAVLLREINPQVQEIIRMLELMKELNVNGQSTLVPPVTERLLERGDVAKNY